LPFIQKSCVNPEDAAKLVNKHVCIDVHVYDAVELADGTRFLDECAPDTPDENCGLIVSLRVDREEVGALREFRDADVDMGGIVRPMHGRSRMEAANCRSGLRPHGGHRAFTNSRNQEALPRWRRQF
jgi:hypothetical protein